MNNYNIEIGCKEYVIKCMCGEDAVEYCHNMTTAIRMFREQGWTISSMRTLCPKCNARSKSVTERPTIEQNDERGISI